MNLNSNESRENSCNARNELKCPSAIGSQVALVLGMEYENEDLGGGWGGGGGGVTYLKGSNAETGKTTASQSEKIQNIVFIWRNCWCFAQQIFTYSTLAIKTIEKGVKCIQK